MSWLKSNADSKRGANMNIDLIVWDLDGTKYRLPPNMASIVDMIIVPIIQRRLAESRQASLEPKKIIELAKKSHEQRGSILLYFVEEYGFDWRDLHAEFNDNLPIEIVTDTPCPWYKSLIQQTKKMGIKHVIFTHGNKAWASKVLKKLDLIEEFPAERIFDLTTTDGSLKHHGIQPYQELFKNLAEHVPERALMVEDTYINLIGAKQIGMQTAIIDYLSNFSIRPEHVDYIFTNPQALLQRIIYERLGHDGLPPI